MLDNGISIETISNVTGLSVNEVRFLADEKNH
jgi:hypothetical protein